MGGFPERSWSEGFAWGGELPPPPAQPLASSAAPPGREIPPAGGGPAGPPPQAFPSRAPPDLTGGTGGEERPPPRPYRRNFRRASVPPPDLTGGRAGERASPPRPERRKWRKGGWTGWGKRGAGPRGGKREGSLAIGSNAESVVEYVARTHDLRMTQTRLQRRGREVASLSRRGIRRVIDFPFANFRPEFVYETGATTNCANSTH